MARLLIFTFLSLSLLLSAAYGKNKGIKGIYYLKNLYGVLHSSASNNSEVLTTLACGHPIKIIENKTSSSFYKVSVGPYKGYLVKEYLSRYRPKCMQDKYPVFWNELNLNVNDFYYWGKLYDQVNYGRSKIQ